MMSAFKKGLSRYFSTSELSVISSLKVGIAGAGGLGSNCAMNLVRSGFTRLVLVDEDSIESSNLNRQFFFVDQIGLPKVEALASNLLRINRDLQLELRQLLLTRDNLLTTFAGCDYIVEAFDDPAAKKLIIETFGNRPEVIVAASGIAGSGQTDAIITRKLGETLYLVGDLASESSEELPPYSPGVNIAAAKQADVILNHALTRAAGKK